MSKIEMINEIVKMFNNEDRKMIYFSLLLCNTEDVEQCYNEIMKK